MQYDARRSDPKSAKAKPEAPDSAPLLRERLLDVVRRDRAIAAIAVAQQAQQAVAPQAEVRRDADSVRPDAGLEAEAKSGTHVRLPGYARALEDESWDDVEDEYTVELKLERGLAPTSLESEPSPSLSLFASWIEEEIIEIDGSSDMPIEFLAEPPPVPEAARARSVPPQVIVPEPEPQAVEQGLELILEADAELLKQEPIRTRTMARLLAGHGYAGRALSIYEYLIAKDPSDVSLRVEAEALRSAHK